MRTRPGFLLLGTLVVSLLFPVASATAWANGPDWGNGFGTHDWMLYEAKRMAKNPSWLSTKAALTKTDDPDMEFHDFWYHVYDRWGTNYGDPPKKIQYYYDLAVSAYADKDYAKASRNVGLMSHYVVDSHDPLHTDSSDNEDQVHGSWEDAVDELTTYKGEHRSWLHDDGYKRVRDIRGRIWSGAKYAHKSYGPLIEQYIDHGYNGTVDKITRNSLNRGVNDLADLIQSIPAAARE